MFRRLRLTVGLALVLLSLLAIPQAPAPWGLGTAPRGAWTRTCS